MREKRVPAQTKGGNQGGARDAALGVQAAPAARQADLQAGFDSTFKSSTRKTSVALGPIRGGAPREP